VAVADNGIGIAPEHAQRVFKLFQRLHNEETYEGTGIGLSICKKVVDLYAGQISVRPNEPAGTCFELWLQLDAD
jgi:signal transduction histidine kinase